MGTGRKWCRGQVLLCLFYLFCGVLAQTDVVVIQSRTRNPQFSTSAETLEVDVNIKAVSSVETQPNIRLSLVVDTSSSVEGPKLEVIKESGRYLAKKLAASEGVLSVTTFNETVSRMVKDQIVKPDTVSIIEEEISAIAAGGRTDLRDGILNTLSLFQAFEDVEECRSHEIFLLSDGDRNPVVNTNTSLQQEISGLLPDKQRLTTFSLGLGAKHEFLKAVADAGGGESYPIGRQKDVALAIGDAFAALQTTVAEDVTITLTPLADVVINNVRTSGKILRNDTKWRIRFPTLQLEETRTMLVELDVPEVDEPGDQEILFTSMSYFDIAQCRRIRAEALPISAMRTPLDPNVNDVTIQRSKEVTEADWRLAVSDVYSETAVAMQNGDIETAEEVMQRVALGLESVDMFEESEQLQSLRDGTLALGAQLDDVTEANAFGVALFESLGDALSKQRATLGNVDDYEFLRFFDTTAKRAGREEASEVIMGALAKS